MSFLALKTKLKSADFHLYGFLSRSLATFYSHTTIQLLLRGRKIDYFPPTSSADLGKASKATEQITVILSHRYDPGARLGMIQVITLHCKLASQEVYDDCGMFIKQ